MPLTYMTIAPEVSAIEDIGPHLLARKRPHPDRQAGDFRLERVLEKGSVSPLDLALDAMINGSHGAAQVRAWAKIATSLIDQIAPSPAPIPTPTPPPPPPTPTPTPTPTPPPPSGAVDWTDTETKLDQGQTGHCVGFGEAQWGNTLPVDDKEDNAAGHANYYRCKIIDGEPKAEDGSSVHSAASDLVATGRLSVYAWASTTAAMITWVTQHGPLIMGLDWYNDMFNPDPSGLVVPTGGIAGGHCFVCVGYDPATNRFKYLNSWSDQWGPIGGYFYMNEADQAMLLASSGAECMAAVELPLAA